MARILVVDDSKFIKTSLKLVLEQDEHEVVAMGSDGIEGFELFQSMSPDLVLLDITMPNRDGRDCLNDIIQANAEARVIMISAIKEQDIVDGCINDGARDFIQKPLQLGDDDWVTSFYAKIRNALN
jgi:two-component system chemotaxis response regulator CheY